MNPQKARKGGRSAGLGQDWGAGRGGRGLSGRVGKESRVGPHRAKPPYVAFPNARVRQARSCCRSHTVR